MMDGRGGEVRPNHLSSNFAFGQRIPQHVPNATKALPLKATANESPRGPQGKVLEERERAMIGKMKSQGVKNFSYQGRFKIVQRQARDDHVVAVAGRQLFDPLMHDLATIGDLLKRRVGRKSFLKLFHERFVRLDKDKFIMVSQSSHDLFGYGSGSRSNF